MDGEQVTAKILADASDEAARIRGEAAQKQAAAEAAMAEQLRQYEAQTQALAEKAGRDKRSRILSAARMEMAKEYLTEKTRLLDDVFLQAQARLSGLNDGEYRELMIRLMSQAAERGEQEVVLDRSEKRIDQSLIDEVNRRLASSGKGPLRLSGERQDLGGGFVLRSGRVQSNVSLKVLLAQARDALEMELAKELFGS